MIPPCILLPSNTLEVIKIPYGHVTVGASAFSMVLSTPGQFEGGMCCVRALRSGIVRNSRRSETD